MNAGAAPAALAVGGLVRLSSTDWPGQLAAVVFCQGCPWRCRYCHNPHLMPFGAGTGPAWPEVLRWLGTRRGLLDAVVFTGGEATSQPGLPEALDHVRALGFRAGLHTSGASPRALSRALSRLDWVGFDLKAPFDAYRRVTGGDHGSAVAQSYRLLRDSGVAHEVRTTWHPALLSPDDLSRMAAFLASVGERDWVIQAFRPVGCADAALCAEAPGALPDLSGAHPGLRITVR